jgi:hypothetical protein
MRIFTLTIIYGSSEPSTVEGSLNGGDIRKYARIHSPKA